MILFSKNPAFDLEKWANCTSIEMGERKHKVIPSGWCSWYHYFASVSEKDIISNLNWLKKHKEDLKLDYVVVDDGYEKSVGDWLEVNKKFPHGMKWIAEKIKEAGFKPGIWTAPFFAAKNSSVYKKHKNWFIKDKQGKPVVAGISPVWKTVLYALDCTNPEVENFLNTTFRTLSEWGYEFF
ncbi:MAG: alpha-galactosidase, partial [Candidatus Omnitrophica bacterium]|nr:alpha-galactosidase [Candidatus Omnitrophota bacterium]